MPVRALFATTLCLALAAPAARPDTPPAAEARSTGNAETRVVEPPQPQQPVKVAFAGAETRKLVEGKTRAGSPAVVLWSAPVGKMLNAELMTEGNAAVLVVLQAEATEPDGGTAEKDGAVRWIGECSRAGELRLEVRTKSEREIPFKLGIEVAPGAAVAP